MFFWAEVVADKKGTCHMGVIKAGCLQRDVFSHLFYIRFSGKTRREILRENAEIRLQKFSCSGGRANGKRGFRVVLLLRWKGKQ